MGNNTRFSTAIFGALLMFFLGSNLTLISEYTGLIPQHILKWFGTKTMNLLSTPKARKPRIDPVAEMLERVLQDDKRELCRTRYPNGLIVTDEQKEYMTSQRYFVVLTLRNNEEMLHHTLYELLHVIKQLGPKNIFVSIFENNSKDKTPQFLAFFTDMLKLAGVQHHLVSSLTWASEVEAVKAAAAATSSTSTANQGKTGRRLLSTDEEVNTIYDGSDTVNGTAVGSLSSLTENKNNHRAGSFLETSTRLWQKRQQLLMNNKGSNTNIHHLDNRRYTRSSSSGSSHNHKNDNGNDESPTYNRQDDEKYSELRDQTDLSEEQLNLLLEALEIAEFESSASPSSSISSSSTASSSILHGRRLEEKNNPVSTATTSDVGDILSFDSKWKGNRIEFLARVRNWSIRPLFGQRRKYTKLILMNDAYVCSEDILRLVLHKDADVACGLDFDTTSNYGIGFYDTWVDRDVHGEPFKKHAPFVQRGPDADLLKLGKPFPVFCCWNGVLVASSIPFYDGVRFRRSKPGECAASECSLFCKDYWIHGKGKFVIDPHVRVAYDIPTYNGLHNVKWLQEGPLPASALSAASFQKHTGPRIGGPSSSHSTAGQTNSNNPTVGTKDRKSVV